MRTVPFVSLCSLLLAGIVSSGFAADPLLFAPPVPEAITADEFGSSFATDGENVLTLWKKDGSLIASITNPNGTAKGTPVVLLAKGLDPMPGTVSAAAWNGQEYLSVWSATFKDPSRNGVYAVRLSREGELLSPTRKILGGNQTSLALAWNGQRFLLAATGFPSNSSQGIFLDSEGNTIASARLDSSVEFIEPLGKSFLLARPGLFQSYVAILDASLEARLLPVAAAPTFDIASDGSRALSVSSFSTTFLDLQVFDAVHVDPPIRLEAPGYVREVRVVASDRGYVAILRTELVNGVTELYALEISAAGSPMTPFLRLAGQQGLRLLDAVAVASDVIVAYRGDSRSPLFALRTSTGTSFPLSVGRPDQVRPLITGSSDGYFVAWTELVASGRRLVGSRIRSDGTGVGERVVFATGDFRGYDVEFDGTDFLVSWTTEEGIHLQRISGSGVLRDSATLIKTSPDAWDVALSWNGFATLLAWSNYLSAAETRRIQGALLRDRQLSTLGVISRPAPIALWPGGGEYDPHLAWTGSHWVLTWQTAPGGFCELCPSMFTAIRIAPTGMTIDATPVVVPGVEVSSNGVDSLIVFKTESDQIRGTRLSADGTLLDGMDGFPISEEGSDPTVIGTGMMFAVTWVAVDFSTNSKHFVLASVEGTSVSALRAAPRRQHTLAENPAMASGANSTLLIAASERNEQEPFFESSLITGRFAAELLPVGLPPSSPTSVEATYDGSSYMVTWTDSSDNEDAFVIAIGPGPIWAVSVPADAESAHIRSPFGAPSPTSVQVWAQNAAGRSAVVTVTVRPARARISKN